MARQRSTNGGAYYPPQSISIRGSGGPFVVIVGNVAKGTTTEDIQLTFEPFGPVEDVRERAPPSLNYPSLSFEVTFARRDDANAACASLNGCLADGRVLSVAPRTPETISAAFGNQASAAVRDRLNDQGRIDPGPAPLPRSAEVNSERPSSGQDRTNKNKQKALLATGPAESPKPAPSLQKRMGLGESPAEKKARAVKKAVKATKQGKLSTTPSLKSRITIPLSERIGVAQTDPKKRSKLEPTKTQAKKAKAAKAVKVAPNKPFAGTSTAARKRAAKRAAKAAVGDGMELD